MMPISTSREFTFSFVNFQRIEDESIIHDNNNIIIIIIL